MAQVFDSTNERNSRVWRNPARKTFVPTPYDQEEMPPDPFGEKTEDNFSASDVARLLRAANAPSADGDLDTFDLMSATEPEQTAASLAPPAPRATKKKRQEMPQHGHWEVQIRQGKRWGWLASFYGQAPDKDRIRERFGAGEFRMVEQTTGFTSSFTIAHAPSMNSWDSSEPAPAQSRAQQKPVEQVVAETVSAVVPAAVNEAISGLMEQFQPLIAGFMAKDEAPKSEDSRVEMMERELEMTRAALAQMVQQQQHTPQASHNPVMEAVMEKVISAGMDNLGLREKDEDEGFVGQALKAATAMFEARALSAANAPQPPPQIAQQATPQRPTLNGMTAEVEQELRQHAQRLGLDFNEAIVEAQSRGVAATTLLNIARAQ